MEIQYTTSKIRNIEVIDPEIINPNIVIKMETTQEIKNVDLSTLSAAALKAELKKREEANEANRETYKKLVEQTVAEVVFKLAVVSEELSKAKTKTFKCFEDILKLKADIYGTKEEQYTHTFTSEKASITIGYRVNDAWDDTVNTGIAKVKEYIKSLAKDEQTALLVETVFNLLKKDAKGNLKANRMVELKNMSDKFNNELFSDGVKIIMNAYKPVRSVWFIDASLINVDGSKTSIPLNISSVDFADGYEFNFYKEDGNNNSQEN